MAFCRLCKQSSKVPNKIVQANSFGDSFIFCLKCKLSSLASCISPVSVKTNEAARALQEASTIRSNLSKGQSDKRFRILIWGPSPKSSDPVAMKRLQLKAILTSEGHEVFFSEDLEAGDQPLNVQEAHHLSIVDIVICFASSLGSTGEAHELLAGLGKRVLVWFDEKAKDAYAGRGLARTLVSDGSKVEYYDDDFVSCCALIKGSLWWIDGLIANENMADFYRRKSDELRIRRDV